MNNNWNPDEQVYRSLKSRIISGYYPTGECLPSRAAMCEQYQASERTIRKVLQILAADGYIETKKRLLPRVIYEKPADFSTLTAGEVAQIRDIIAAAQIVIQILARHGLSLLTGPEFDLLERLIGRMSIEKVRHHEYWHLCTRFWRRCIAKADNELAVRITDSLSEFFPVMRSMSYEMKDRCRESLKETVYQARRGVYREEPVPFEAVVYEAVSDPSAQSRLREILALSPYRSLDDCRRFINGKENYDFMIFTDLLRGIAAGRYTKGNFIPTHKMLMQMYNVSFSTTIAAVKLLQELKIVQPVGRKGNQVIVNARDLGGLPWPKDQIAPSLRRFLDKMQLLVLTVGRAAALAMPESTQAERKALYEALRRPDESRPVKPHALVGRFIIAHLPCETLQILYACVYEDYFYQWGILGFQPTENELAEMRRLDLESTAALVEDDTDSFSRLVTERIRFAYEAIVEKSRAGGYWEAVAGIYKVDHDIRRSLRE